ncbi:hypothetical protein C900_04928 [Fulvivirga imtechensis AK7]|uniref:RagB/SusD domain-containing protein n=1 Tax=Fulvivirga imtechensis AK7 TaxID=1237149 RepID=L8JL54_9BACT|nr:RagB/SusD family nutrient uptake outer membrane protein [Fulvivirga imtechensis]ELR69540.1 hypothetical protein C900_04928 [Fulvivirga imtechensis AK7]
MIRIKYWKYTFAWVLSLLVIMSCDVLDEPLQNVELEEETDYTKSEDMVLLLYGAYGEFNDLQWETFPTISVRGDDVNAAGDQEPLTQTDEFKYDRNFWMYNSTWLNLYNDIFLFNGLMESINFYKESGANAAEADQYIAEIKVMRAFELLQIARLWGDILVPATSVPAELEDTPLSTFEEAMQHISDQMDEAISDLPPVRPNQRTDIQGGVTRYTAYAVKAMANLELKNYQKVADATGEIIGAGLFHLEPDFYQLFKIPGKLSDESLMELQYSDFGTSSGTSTSYLWEFFGPGAYTPAVAGSGGGWGFWEPTVKYIKFMLDRGEEERLVTSVIFTPDGIAEIQSDPEYAPLPAFISTTSPDGDQFENHTRYDFLSGKHYLPTVQLTPGRTKWGENNNFRVIRYAEVLLMHAEALVNGASSAVMSADDAVNEVRGRAGLGAISGVTLDNVLDEKFAEFAMEWGIRFYDLVRHGRTAELNHDGIIYEEGKDRFLPYPLEQVDALPQLQDGN